MINWTEIDAEVEEFQDGYRSGFVSIFKKYEGQETEERTAQGHVVKVTVVSFGRRYGIAETTFRGWVDADSSTPEESKRNRPGPNQRAIDQAAADAKAKAEAVAADQLAKALAAQEIKAETEAQRRAQESAAAAKRVAEAYAAKVLAAAKEEAKLDKLEALNRQAKQLKDAAKAEGFDLTQMTDADKAKVMIMLGNDPEQARDFFRALNEDRARRTDEATAKAQAEQDKRRGQMAEREAREAARKASLAYEESALCYYLTKVYPVLIKFEDMMKDKPINFDAILYSRLAPSQIVPKFDRGEDIVCAGREAIFLANAENELADIATDTD